MACKIRAAELIAASQAISAARGTIASDAEMAKKTGVREVCWGTLCRWRDAAEQARRLLARIVESCNVTVEVEGPATETQTVPGYPEEEPEEAADADAEVAEEDEEQDSNPYDPGHRSNGTGLSRM